MKKCLLIMLAWACTAAVAMMAAGCAEPSLQECVDAVNKRCPEHIRGVGQLMEVAMTGDTIVYTTLVTNPRINMDSLSVQGPQYKVVMAPQLGPLFSPVKGYARSVVAKQAWLKLSFKRTPRDAALEIYYSPKELAAILEGENR